VQSGSTSQMIMPVAGLVEYLSAFMTLLPGDLILTGTPHGIRFVAPGDTVVCEIEKLGALTNHLGVAG
jgi:5-oxopent-3-ene-1,2,5-tricarboxylate decarboxylase/2-hydroxyhepta-2,4-diene-1,7-dioate isomerase